VPNTSKEFTEREEQFRTLKEQYVNGIIKRDSFIRAVDTLRFRDANGTWWQPSYEDGAWLQWDGSAWIPGGGAGTRSPVDMGDQSQGGAPVQRTGPAGLGLGIIHFLKSFVKSAILGFMKNIPWMILIAIVVWLLHLLLLGIANPSATPGNISGLASILVIPGNEVVGAIFWLLLSWLISTLIFQVRTKRFGKSLQQIGRIPAWINESFHSSQALSLLLFSMGFVVALIIAALIQNVIISVQLILVSLGWLVAQKEGVMVVFIGAIWGSVSRTFASEKKSAFNPSFAGSAIFGLSVGFLMSLVIPLNGLTGILVVFFIFILIVTIVVARERK